jgi:hypothetical protein
MVDPMSTLTGTVAAITAVGALGTASFGLVDATKAFGGGVSNFGFNHVLEALAPFQAALDDANKDWRLTLKANWINGVAKEDQKTAAKNLIRLGLNAVKVAAMAAAGHVVAGALGGELAKIQSNTPLTNTDAQVLGRFNGMIDAAMDAGFERGDQQYRNACKVAAALFALVLAIWAGYLLAASGMLPDVTGTDFPSKVLWPSVLVGLIAVPIAPIAKDLASSLQAAGAAVKSVES